MLVKNTNSAFKLGSSTGIDFHKKNILHQANLKNFQYLGHELSLDYPGKMGVLKGNQISTINHNKTKSNMSISQVPSIAPI